MAKAPWGYLVAAGVLGAAAGTVILAPDALKGLAGPARTPDGLGSEPTVTGQVGGDLAAKEAAAALDGVGKVDLAPAVAAAPKEPVKPVAGPVDVGPSFPDEDKAKAVLAEARALYLAMEWDKADSAARRLTPLKVSPATRGKGKDIERSAAKLKKLFADLDERDELTRNFETHPSLVKVGGRFAVPIRSMDNPEPVVEGHLAWIASQQKTGKAAFLVQGKKDFIPTVLADVGAVETVDVPAVIAERTREFETRLVALNADGTRARDAVTWYEAGKFAYRNRIDAQVVPLLDRALDLDPMLNRTVRESNAQGLMANMIAHIKNGNRKQAEAFMASINRRYKDTATAAEAKAYFDNDQKAVLALAKKADDDARLAEEERKKERIRIAKESEDKEALARIEREEADAKRQAEEEAAAAKEAPVGDGSVAKADELSAKGREPYASAMNMGPTPERNKLYHEAVGFFNQALKLYDAYLEKHPDDEAVMTRRLETNKMRFAAHKYGTL